MIYVTEAQSRAIVTPEFAFEAVRAALIAATDPSAASFPVVNAHANDPQNRFSIKSAAGAGLAGFKVGAYFPSNDAHGLPRHASTIMLIDQASGKIGALIEGSAVNCFRTAAADAVATDALARRDAKVLTLFGTGHQAVYEARAIARIRDLSQVLVVGRDTARTATFVEKLRADGLPAQSAKAQDAVRRAGGADRELEGRRGVTLPRGERGRHQRRATFGNDAQADLFAREAVQGVLDGKRPVGTGRGPHAAVG